MEGNCGHSLGLSSYSARPELFLAATGPSLPQELSNRASGRTALPCGVGRVKQWRENGHRSVDVLRVRSEGFGGPAYSDSLCPCPTVCPTEHLAWEIRIERRRRRREETGHTQEHTGLDLELLSREGHLSRLNESVL